MTEEKGFIDEWFDNLGLSDEMKSFVDGWPFTVTMKFIEKHILYGECLVYQNRKNKEYDVIGIGEDGWEEKLKKMGIYEKWAEGREKAIERSGKK